MYRSQKISLIIALFGLFFLSACRSNSPALTNYISYTNEASGISFEYPETWIIKEEENEITLASKEEFIDSDKIAGGATVNIFLGPATGFEGDLIAILSELVTLMTEQENAEIVTEAKTVRINNQDAATVTFSGQEGNTTIIMRATIIMAKEKVAFMIILHDSAEEETFGPIGERITNSMKFG